MLCSKIISVQSVLMFVVVLLVVFKQLSDLSSDVVVNIYLKYYKGTIIVKNYKYGQPMIMADISKLKYRT